MNRLAQFIASICCCYAVLLIGGCSEAPAGLSARTASFAFNSPQRRRNWAKRLSRRSRRIRASRGFTCLPAAGPMRWWRARFSLMPQRKSIDFQYFMFRRRPGPAISCSTTSSPPPTVACTCECCWTTIGRPDATVASLASGAHPNIELRVSQLPLVVIDHRISRARWITSSGRSAFVGGCTTNR